MKTVTAADANRNFSKLLAAVRGGESVEITSHGKAVARLVAATQETDAERIIRLEEARRALWARIDNQPPTEVRWKFNRDELYDD